MGIKRSKPLMIDSHATLTNLNDTVDDSVTIQSIDRKNIIKIDEDDSSNSEPKRKYMRTGNSNGSLSGSGSRKSSFNLDSTTVNPMGIVINDITDNLIKSALNGSSNLEDEVQNIKMPFVDLGVDSPTSNQVGA
jgi:hypothetical protein